MKHVFIKFQMGYKVPEQDRFSLHKTISRESWLNSFEKWNEEEKFQTFSGRQPSKWKEWKFYFRGPISLTIPSLAIWMQSNLHLAYIIFRD